MLLINVFKMQTNVSILTFMSSINTTSDNFKAKATLFFSVLVIGLNSIYFKILTHTSIA